MTAAPDQRAVALLGLAASYRSSGRTTWIEATGRSMRPAIPAGSSLLVEFGILPDRAGDIVVFQRGERLIAHRAVARRKTTDGERWIVRGDDEGFFDPVLAEVDILGVVRSVRHPDGRNEDLRTSRRRDALLATVSWWSGRAAGVLARALRRLPVTPSVRRVATAAVVDLSRVPTRVVHKALPRS